MGDPILITSRQIRDALTLLRWHAHRLERHAGLPVDTILRAEFHGREAVLDPRHAAALRQALECVGIEFIPKPVNGASVRLKQPRQVAPEQIALVPAPSLAQMPNVLKTRSFKRLSALFRRFRDDRR